MSNNIKQNIAELEKLSPAEWDDICTGCGVCCICKYELMPNKTTYMNFICDKFDIKTKRCKCYENRLNKDNNCVKVNLDVIRQGLVPDSCAYAQRIYGLAKYPANPNWSKMIPVTPKQIDKLGLLEVLRNCILGSDRWTSRRC